MSIKAVTIMAAAAFMLLTAILLNNVDQLYFMGSVLLAVAIISRLLVKFSLKGLQTERRVIDRVFEDEAVLVQLTLRNTSRFPKLSLIIQDQLSPWLEADNDGQAKFFIPIIWPGQQVELEYSCRATKRGRLTVGPMIVGATDPIGMIYRDQLLTDSATAVVYPKPLNIPAHNLEGAAIFGGGVAERVTRAGDGLDFHGVRDYQPGDELRRIHWKAVARLQRLAVIEFQQSYTADVAIALDLAQGTDIGAGRVTTLEYGVKIAASLARRALDNGTCVTLAQQGLGPHNLELFTCHKPEQFYRLLEMLANAEACAERSCRLLVQTLRGELTPGTAVVLITSDADLGLVSLTKFLDAANISFHVVLLDSNSFLQSPAVDASPASALPESFQSLLANSAKPKATNIYHALADNLRDSGARVHLVRRGDDLVEAVRQVMGGVE